MKTTLITIVGFAILSLIYAYSADKVSAIILIIIGLIAYILFLLLNPFKELKQN
jgi:uncharacterized membrane protein YuzA (DUF378 family)